jgi:two-component sensor histidine kinase
MELRPKTLLLVEDEMIIALAESNALQKEGYMIIHVPSGEGAIELMDSGRGASIDLILMDINLGDGIDGIEAAHEILDRHDIPIVFLSSHTEEKIVKRTEKITSYGYVVKNLGYTMLFVTIRMAFRLHNAQLQMKEREERFRSLIDKIQEGVCIMDENDRFLYSNSVIETAFGAEHGDLVGKPLSFFVGEKAIERAHEHFENDHRGKQGELVDAIILANQEPKRIRARVIPEFDTRQQLKGSIAIIDFLGSSDHVERLDGGIDVWRMNEEQELLLHELKHRMKNSLNVIISLLSLEAQRLTDESAQEILVMTEARIRSIALLYDFLSHSSSLDKVDSVEYLHDLDRLLMETYTKVGGNIRVRENIDRFELDSRTCFSIGLIVNELFSNSLKHAFPSGRDGTVTIELRKEGSGFILCVRDDGVGFSPGFKWKESQGFGMQLVLAMGSQLGGTVDVVDNGGIAVTVKVDLSNKEMRRKQEDGKPMSAARNSVSA